MFSLTTFPEQDAERSLPFNAAPYLPSQYNGA
jgi:hypothetical protein